MTLLRDLSVQCVSGGGAAGRREMEGLYVSEIRWQQRSKKRRELMAAGWGRGVRRESKKGCGANKNVDSLEYQKCHLDIAWFTSRATTQPLSLAFH